MTFSAPGIAILAAAVAVPLLVILYVLKLRRRRLRMASTLLWQRSFDDLQVNVPFQRLRLGPLFLLQLVLLLLLLLALAEPVIEPTGTSGSRVLLLIDRSASMNAADGDPAGDPEGNLTRLDAAKAAAREFVERLSRGGASTPVMVIAFGARAQLVTGFESRRAVLAERIDAIEPTDEEANLAAALQLAGNFAGAGEGASEDAPDVVLISDGVAPPEDSAGFALRTGRFRFIAVGDGPGVSGTDVEATSPAPGNVGVVSLSARRDYQDPARVLVFARLVNTGAEPVETIVTLLVDGTPGSLQRVTIPPPAGPAARTDAAPDAAPDADASEPGRAAVTFSLDLPGGAVLSLRHSGRDLLAADDTAAVILPPPARPRIALVHGPSGPDAYLLDLLAEFEPRLLLPLTLEAYEAIDPLDLDLGRRFELVVFDGVAPPRLPGVPTVTFGAVPPGLGAVAPASPGGARILSWRRRHPIMRHVSLDTVVYAGFGGFELPAGATSLATGPQGPVLALQPARGAQHIAVGFALGRSNWPTHVSVTVFMQNVLDFLTLSRSGQASLVVRPGEAVSVRATDPMTPIVVSFPDGAAPVTLEAAGDPGARLTLPVLRRVGLYTVTGAEPPWDRVAVSLLSEVESDVRPRRALLVNAEAVEAGAVAEAAPRGIWPWFVAGALAFVVLEWLVYCRLLRME